MNLHFKFSLVIIFCVSMLISESGLAAYVAANSSGNLTINGFVYNSGTPVTDATVSATVQIQDQTNCVLYTESFVSNLNINGGAYSITLGANGTFPGGQTKLSQIFDPTLASIAPCSTNGTTAKWHMAITSMSGPGGVYIGASPLYIPINSVPFATIAENVSATSNSTLTSLPSLSLTGSQVSTAVANATSAASLSGTLPVAQVTGLGPLATLSTTGSTLTFLRGDGTWGTPVGGGSPTGAATGDLASSYPGPSVAKVNGVSYPISPATNTVPVVTAGNTITYQAVPIAAGGTGATSAAAAFNAIAASGGTVGGALSINGNTTITGNTTMTGSLNAGANTITAANFAGNATSATSAGSVTGTVGVANGGTGATTAAAARTSLAAAQSGINGDITSLTTTNSVVSPGALTLTATGSNLNLTGTTITLNGATTMSGALSMGSNNITTSGIITAASFSGNATSATNANNLSVTSSSGGIFYPTLVQSSSGNLPVSVNNTSLNYNGSNSTFSAPNISATSNNSSTSPSTGAIIVAASGGIGVGGNINAGGNVNSAGPITSGGLVQSIAGGFKFPDGTTQTTAVVTNLTYSSAFGFGGGFPANSGFTSTGALAGAMVGDVVFCSITGYTCVTAPLVTGNPFALMIYGAISAPNTLTYSFVNPTGFPAVTCSASGQVNLNYTCKIVR